MSKKILGWAVVAFLAYYLFSDPAGAGHSAHSLLQGLEHAGNSLAKFANHLGS